MPDKYTALPERLEQRQAFAMRFWDRVSKVSDGCWEWRGSLTRGYGQIEFKSENTRRNVKAHRVSYELLRGPIPGDLHLDHLCRNPKCVNPDHLEPVTSAENTKRGMAGEYMRQRQSAKTHCPEGHAYSETEYRSPKTGYRHCKECSRIAVRRWRQRRAAELNAEWL